jgi:hypothetical protein
MEKRKVLTSHSRLARFARERTVLDRLSALTDAVREHQRRTAAILGPSAHDEVLYQRLREAGELRVSRPGH